MSSRATFIESLLGAGKFYYSHFFHVFENCFGPPGAGEFRFEQIPRTILRSICCALGPEIVKHLTPKKWIHQAEAQKCATLKRGPSIKEWLPLQVANFTTWPRFVPTVRYPPPPTEVAGSSCRITYCGHSGVLIQTQETNVIIDPFFGSRYGFRFVMARIEAIGLGSEYFTLCQLA